MRSSTTTILLLSILVNFASSEEAVIYVTEGANYTVFANGFQWRETGPLAVLKIGEDTVVPVAHTQTPSGMMFEFSVAKMLSSNAIIHLWTKNADGSFSQIIPLKAAVDPKSKKAARQDD